MDVDGWVERKGKEREKNAHLLPRAKHAGRQSARHLLTRKRDQSVLRVHRSVRRRHTRVPPPKDAGHPSLLIRITQSFDCFLSVSHPTRILQPPAKGSAQRVRALAVAPARDESRTNGIGACEATAVLGRLSEGATRPHGEGQMGREESNRLLKYCFTANLEKIRSDTRPGFTQ